MCTARFQKPPYFLFLEFAQKVASLRPTLLASRPRPARQPLATIRESENEVRDGRAIAATVRTLT